MKIKTSQHSGNLPSDYGLLLANIKEQVRSSQYSALKAVNTALVGLYWGIGQMIAERQEHAGWGKAVVQHLANDLQQAFPGMAGFSTSNLWRMKAFFEIYHEDIKLAPLVREISWSHNILIMERCANHLEREFYLRTSRKFGWSKNVLMHHIENQSYQKTLLGQTNFDQALTPNIRAQAKLAVKDSYTFDFIDLGEEYSERELERSLISKVESFLRSMGGMFAFVGSQYRIEVDGREFFIDIVLFHRSLRCLIAIELKIGDFQPEYVGKMQFYLTALEENTRHEGENPPIGIILCKEKSRTIVEYALYNAKTPIGVATYEITKTLPHELKGQLPSPQDIIKLLESID